MRLRTGSAATIVLDRGLDARIARIFSLEGGERR